MESLEFQHHEVLLLGFLVDQKSETISRPIGNSLSVELHFVMQSVPWFFIGVGERDCLRLVPVLVEFDDGSLSK